MNFKSINSRIAILIAVIVLVSVSGFVLVVSNMTNKAVLKIQKQNMEMLNSKIVDETERFLGLSIRELKAFANNKEYRRAFFDTYSRGEVLKSLKLSIEDHGGLLAIAAYDKKGKIVFGQDGTGRNLGGMDVSHESYIDEVLNGSELALSKISRTEYGNENALVMSVPVKDPTGRIFGGFFIVLNWDKYSEELIGNITIGSEGYAYLLNSEGQIIAHKVDQNLIGKDVSSHGFVQDSMSKDKGFNSYDWEGRQKVQSFQVVPRTGWIVCMSAYKSDLTRVASEQSLILLGMGSCMILVLVGAIVLTIRRQVVDPIARIRDFTSEVEDGNLKAVLDGKFTCELHDLAENVKHMVEELKNKLGFSEGVLNGLVLPCAIVGPDNNMLWINSHMCELIESPIRPDEVSGMNPGEFFFRDRNKQTLSQIALREERQIRKETEYTTISGAVKHIAVSTTPFYDMDRQLLGSVAIWFDMTEVRQQQRQIEENNIVISEAAASATDVSNQVTRFTESLAAQVEQSSRGAEEQSIMASEAATAMDEMNSTVFEVARNASTAADLAFDSQKKAGEGEEMVARAVETISQIRTQSESMQKDMAELGRQAEGIGNIMSVISDIADQTNLLALNAAIEAARAGDAGRGFAVVADEVRKLAEKTMTATNEVGEYIVTIQNSARTNIANTEQSTQAINDVTAMINKSGNVLKEIVASISETSDQVRSIATASEEQSAASEQISRSAGQINSIASETSRSMNESAEAVGKVAELALELNRIIARMQG